MKILTFDSEAAWIEARRRFITATMIARLMVSKANWWDVWRERETGDSGFSGNEYTEHGKKREPEIAKYVQVFIDGRFGHNDDPQDLYVADDGVSAATPDMVITDGDGVEAICEIKTVTAAREWPLPNGVTDVEDCIPLLYWFQVQWQLYVTDAAVCVFVWEPHIDFEPVGDPKHLFISRDEAAIAQMCAVRDEFLAGKWRDELRPSANTILERLHEVRLQKRPLVEKEQELLDELRECLGDEDTVYEASGLRVTYTLPKPRRTWQAKAFAEAHPDLVDEFTKEVPAKQRTLRITEMKPDV